MRAIGIVAEYNPFHLGHARHIAKSREILGRERKWDVPTVCVMSGSWVQRGECALTDKWTRVRLALQGGADLVLELPAPWAIASAERFARGGIQILRATGVVEWVAFGSESGDLDTLTAVSDTTKEGEYAQILKAELEKGRGFAAARQHAVCALLGEKGRILENPNDNLAVEYLRAMGDDLSAIAVKRVGPAHDSGGAGEGYASASLIRELARRGDWKGVAAWTPEGTVRALQQAGVAHMGYVERAMLARLRSMDQEQFGALPDSGAAEGLPARMYRAARRAGTLEEFYALAKTRRYAHARIRRLALWAFLGMESGQLPEKPAYLRVLGANGRGQSLLKEMKKAAKLPILTKTAHIKELDGEAQRQFALECRATDLFGLCFEQAVPCGADLLRGPVIVK